MIAFNSSVPELAGYQLQIAGYQLQITGQDVRGKNKSVVKRKLFLPFSLKKQPPARTVRPLMYNAGNSNSTVRLG